jgi:hypothetical protein
VLKKPVDRAEELGGAFDVRYVSTVFEDDHLSTKCFGSGFGGGQGDGVLSTMNDERWHADGM